MRTPPLGLLWVTSACMLLVASGGFALADDARPPAGMTPEDFFLRRIRPVLEERCWRCHGPSRQRSNLRLDSRDAVLRGGHVPDVEPGHPETSRLIDAVGYDDGELQMPPDGRLRDDQIADLATWVRMGVPWAEPRAGAAGARDVAVAAARSAESAHEWSWIATAGRFHPLVIHFPIALILAAAFGEGAAIVAQRRGKHLRAARLAFAARQALLLGSVGAVVAACLGWAAAAPTRFSGETATYLAMHRWLGTVVAGLAVATCLLARRDGPLVPAKPLTTYRIALGGCAALVGLVGHLGGSLTHGIDWLGLP